MVTDHSLLLFFNVGIANSMVSNQGSTATISAAIRHLWCAELFCRTLNVKAFESPSEVKLSTQLGLGVRK